VAEAIKLYFAADVVRNLPVPAGYQYTLSIPQHQELAPGLLRKLLRQAEIPPEQFNAL
jgi:hypothetical protein